MKADILPVRSPQAVVRAVELLKDGQLVIIPTETIYGIAALPDNSDAIAHLYEVRDRIPEPASPFLIASVDEMDVLARPNRIASRLARHFWPGSLTLILPANPHYLPAARRALPVALRVPNFPPLLPILEGVGGALFVSGAICCGDPAAITAQEAAALFAADVALILDGGRALFGIPSTILDCISDPPEIRRRGIIPEEKIWDVLGISSPTPAL
ncbi:MAG TPA: L-threonylcarbamoyladenylate synthase [Anaerolineae bacterium]|nr:L-threonylcarbamoyladenylate synthase [Anaerolineae bacterium]HQI86542.1 L-threonylcarbamoyladenylate synthase [Anaerolineae bacterium]